MPSCKNRYLALIRQWLELVHYMLPAALQYGWGIELVSVCTGLLGKEGCVNISLGYKTINRIPFTFYGG